MRKRSSALIVALVLVLAGFFAVASPVPVRKTSYAVSSVQDLLNMDMNGNYTLTGNIAFTESNFPGIGEFENPFRGTFDGANFTIAFGTQENDAGDSWGLFAYVDGATVQRVTVTGGYQRTDMPVLGGIVGTVLGGTVNITSCTSRMTLVSGNTTGGLVGEVLGGTVNINSSSRVGGTDMAGRNFVGGLVGFVRNAQVNIRTSTVGDTNSQQLSPGTAQAIRGIITGGITGATTEVGIVGRNTQNDFRVFSGENLVGAPAITFAGSVADRAVFNSIDVASSSISAWYTQGGGTSGDGIFRRIIVTPTPPNYSYGSAGSPEVHDHGKILSSSLDAGSRLNLHHTSRISIFYPSSPRDYTYVTFKRTASANDELKTVDPFNSWGGRPFNVDDDEDTAIEINETGALTGIEVYYRLSRNTFVTRTLNVHVVFRGVGIDTRDLIRRPVDSEMEFDLTSFFTVRDHTYSEWPVSEIFRFTVTRTVHGKSQNVPVYGEGHDLHFAKMGAGIYHVALVIYIPDPLDIRPSGVIDGYQVGNDAVRFIITLYNSQGQTFTPDDETPGGPGLEFEEIILYIIVPAVVVCSVAAIITVIVVRKKRRSVG